MRKIKIISNPYEKNIQYMKWNSDNSDWKIIEGSEGDLVGEKLSAGFFPYIIHNILDAIIREYNKSEIKNIKYQIIKSQMDSIIKMDLIEYIQSDESKNFRSLTKFVYDFLSAGDAVEKSKGCNNIESWCNSVIDKLNASL